MTETSFPSRNTGVLEAEWEAIHLPMGRGIIDRGGWPYRLTNIDSVTDTVTINVASTKPNRAEAILDGFIHRIDAPKSISIPPVSSDTTYEIGLVYDPTKHQTTGGPIELTAWKLPADTSGGKSRLVLYRMTRKANLALGSTPYTEERPRVCPVISVSRESQLPVSSLVLVDTLAIVRTTGDLFKANIDEAGAITWSQVGGSTTGGVDSGDIDAKITNALGSGWVQATPFPTGHSIARRFDDGSMRVATSTFSAHDALNREAGDGRYARVSHSHGGDAITSRLPFEHVDGSNAAWVNTNLGSTWTSVAVNSGGWLGRYPSALKYKKNIREWDIDPETVVNMTPVKYDLRTETAGEAPDDSSNQGLIGFVADSYVNSVRELVEKVDGEVEGFRYQLMPVAQQVVLRWHEKRVKELEAENEVLRFNQGEILAYLGLNTDDTGRVITDGNN